MRYIFKFFEAVRGLYETCGYAIAMAWVKCSFVEMIAVLRAGNLQAVDSAMGEGPFPVVLRQYGGARFKVVGPNAVSGIREMYVKDVYLRGGWLKFNPGSTVLDLGANMGNFTNMALAMAPGARVIAVEPSRALNVIFRRSVGLNEGHLERTLLLRGFLGKASPKILDAIASDENYRDAKWLTEKDLLDQLNGRSIDFLKCDIEGGEFSLLSPGSRLLSLTNQLACEVHSFAGNVPEFLRSIGDAGFLVGPTQQDSDGTVTFLAKRPVGHKPGNSPK